MEPEKDPGTGPEPRGKSEGRGKREKIRGSELKKARAFSGKREERERVRRAEEERVRRWLEAIVVSYMQERHALLRSDEGSENGPLPQDERISSELEYFQSELERSEREPGKGRGLIDRFRVHACCPQLEKALGENEECSHTAV